MAMANMLNRIIKLKNLQKIKNHTYFALFPILHSVSTMLGNLTICLPKIVFHFFFKLYEENLITVLILNTNFQPTKGKLKLKKNTQYFS